MPLLAGHTTTHLIWAACGGLAFLGAGIQFFSAVNKSQRQKYILPSIFGMLAALSAMASELLVDVPRFSGIAATLSLAYSVCMFAWLGGMWKANKSHPRPMQQSQITDTPEVWPPPPSVPPS